MIKRICQAFKNMIKCIVELEPIELKPSDVLFSVMLEVRRQQMLNESTYNKLTSMLEERRAQNLI